MTKVSFGGGKAFQQLARTAACCYTNGRQGVRFVRVTATGIATIASAMTSNA